MLWIGLGIKAGLGCTPKLITVRAMGEHRKKLILASDGVGLGHYQKRVNDIEAAFNARVEGIRVGRMPRLVGNNPYH